MPRVLLVEGEDDTRALLAQSLPAIFPGLEVEEARSLAGAFALLERQVFQAVVADRAAMPDDELFQWLRANVPDCRRVLTTTAPAMPPGWAADSVLFKPYRLADVAESIVPVAPGPAPFQRAGASAPSIGSGPSIGSRQAIGSGPLVGSGQSIGPAQPAGPVAPSGAGARPDSVVT